MKAYFEPLQELNEYNILEEHLIKDNAPVAVTGCIDGQKEHLISALVREDKNAIIIVENEDRKSVV